MFCWLTDNLSFHRYLRVFIASYAYGGDWGLCGQILLRSHLQPSCHYHLGAQPKHITATVRQVLCLPTHFEAFPTVPIHLFITLVYNLVAPLLLSKYTF